MMEGIKQFFSGQKTSQPTRAPNQPNQTPNSSGEIQFSDNLVSFVNDEYRRRQQERRSFELQWRLNLAFIAGNQYLDINPATGNLEDQPRLYDWEEREVFNHIAPTIETRIAKLSRMRPMLKVRPGSPAREDLHSARIGSQLLANINQDKAIPEILAEAMTWSESCGTVLIKHTWNPYLGPQIGNVENVDEETGQVTQDPVFEGDLDITVCPPQEIFPDSTWRADIEDCRSIIHARAYHIDQIEETWGVRVDPEESSTMQMQRTMTGIGGLGYGLGGYRTNVTKLKDHAIVKEYSEMPSRKYPAGRLIIVAGDKLLYSGPLPYPIGLDDRPGLPYTKISCIKVPGCFWGSTVVERLIPLQRRYNVLRNRKAEYLTRASIGQWSVEDGSVDLDDFERDAGSPGAILVYQRGFSKPDPIEPAQLPAAFETEETTLLNEITIISGVSELSRQSNAPPGVKSGTALSIAVEQDDTRLSTAAANIERAVIASGKIWLRLYKAFAKGPRTLRAVGKDNIVELQDWTASDIRGDDVVIEAASALAESPAQRRQMVFDLLGAGLFNDPDTGRLSKEGRAKIFEMLEYGDWETADDDDRLHMSKAERENRSLMQGALMPSAPFDDHLVHIKNHNRYRLSAEYEELMTQNPQIDAFFQQHVNMHLSFVQAQLAPQVMAPGPPDQGFGPPNGNPNGNPNRNPNSPDENALARRPG